MFQMLNPRKSSKIENRRLRRAIDLPLVTQNSWSLVSHTLIQRAPGDLDKARRGAATGRTVWIAASQISSAAAGSATGCLLSVTAFGLIDTPSQPIDLNGRHQEKAVGIRSLGARSLQMRFEGGADLSLAIVRKTCTAVNQDSRRVKVGQRVSRVISNGDM